MSKLAVALAMAAGIALGAGAASAQPGYSQCIPQYDSSGAQVAPYC